MQRVRHVPHHVVADYAGEREDGKVAKKLFRRDVRQPAKEDHRQRHQRVFTPRRSWFSLFFWRFDGFRRRLRLRGDLNRRRRPGNFALADHRDAAHHYIVEIDGDIAVFFLAQQLQQVYQVGAVELRRLRRQTTRQVGIADNFHAVGGGHDFARHGVFTVAAVLRRQIDHHAARLHGVNHFAGNQLRRRFTRD